PSCAYIGNGLLVVFGTSQSGHNIWGLVRDPKTLRISVPEGQRRLPTWDDCQQLLQVLFTTEERERIQNEARKLVPGDNGQPTTNADTINTSFPLSRPNWDFNTAEGKERLRVYRQALLGGLKAAARKPTNLAKVGDVQQKLDESPAAFLERIQEAFRRCTPMDPEAIETKAAVIIHFVNQAAPDIKKKLQKVDRLGEKSIQDLVAVAEKVYNNRETAEEKREKADDRQTQNLARILLAATAGEQKERERRLRKIAVEGEGKERCRERPQLGKNQCAHCKEYGHWAKDCPKRKQQEGHPKAPNLAVDELND
ncbi:uncharacterized protein LOC110348966, partial [Heterocephalus glaber]|uniref:Uncharacterized protein LOC110348966 n=1 Tax=Heterocephalus glaber TaxID=10181 RepID=A0AAX6SY76_HETGA